MMAVIDFQEAEKDILKKYQSAFGDIQWLRIFDFKSIVNLYKIKYIHYSYSKKYPYIQINTN